MGRPAARVGDMHICPMFDGPKPHVGGPVLPPGRPNVLIGGLPAATVGNLCTCASAPDVIIMGSLGVFIGGMPAARMGDPTAHGGRIVLGCFNVLIGDIGSASSDTPSGFFNDLVNYFKELFDFGENSTNAFFSDIVKNVNPDNGQINCGLIIDAVVDRLTGVNSESVAPGGDSQNGTFEQIEQRFNTKFESKKSFEEVYETVKNGGDGTIGLVEIFYNDGSGNSHVVTIANQNGVVAILEGQGGGIVIKSAEEANKAYNQGGTTTVGVAIIDSKIKEK